jgi:predicted nucleic acid-binding Zn ribbon protein
MPTYSYQCQACNRSYDEEMTIAEMLARDAQTIVCRCSGTVVHVLRPARRHISFHEGFYEHVSEKGEHITSMDQLKRIARENGNYSHYAEDLGGAFPGSKEGRWV